MLLRKKYNSNEKFVAVQEKGAWSAQWNSVLVTYRLQYQKKCSFYKVYYKNSAHIDCNMTPSETLISVYRHFISFCHELYVLLILTQNFNWYLNTTQNVIPSEIRFSV